MLVPLGETSQTPRQRAPGEPLQAWRRLIERNTFGGYADLRRVFNSVDKVGDYFVFKAIGKSIRPACGLPSANERMRACRRSPECAYLVLCSGSLRFGKSKESADLREYAD